MSAAISAVMLHAPTVHARRNFTARRDAVRCRLADMSAACDAFCEAVCAEFSITDAPPVEALGCSTTLAVRPL
jgi:hypothetical protein